ncbi:MAG: cytochrome c biogenesis protein CcdA [Chloroflexi bacterium]|nr:cytochrome c biogenesis protein CcdA [Chloroflexota bacterium]MBI2980577.1 cytochrome c biogenesis protein CcdA [Chloroflexota bacterium]
MIETIVANLANLLPFGFAFGAGMVTTVSPCGIVMLPAYSCLYLGAREEGYWAKSPLRRGIRALGMSGLVTMGFVSFFGVMGAIISLGGQFLIAFIPWVSVLIGAILILLGVYLLLGGHVYTSLPARLANHLTNNGNIGIKGFLVFGVAYGIAALSCTLPVFLTVVGSVLALKGFTSGLLQFVSYALGMGFVIALVTVGSALFKETVNRWLHRLIPLIARLSGLLLIFAGGYILYFWFTVGNILS